MLLAVRFGTRFLIGLLTNLPPGDVTRQAKSPSHQKRQSFQTALSLKGHYHPFHNFHIVDIYIFEITFLTALGLRSSVAFSAI